MASQMVVAPSKDTLFVRGFSARKDVEDVRDFFEKESRSKVLIEFLKQTEMDERLFVALRFETKEVAKDILSRFDNSEVLGDKITLTWFKDLRRARFHKGAYPNRNDNRHPQGRGRYDNYDNYNNYNNRGYGGDRRDNRRSRMDSGGNRNRSRRHERSMSRSISPSRSRSRERESRDSRDRRDDRREDSRSLSPAPTPKHKLKSSVQAAAASKDKDDSDNDRSSPFKESSVSPDRAYTSEPPSPPGGGGGEDRDRDYSPAPPAPRGKNNLQDNAKRNKDNHDDDYQDESFEDGRYQDDKYSRQPSARSQQSRGTSKKAAGYTGDGDDRGQSESGGSRWSNRRNTVDPSPDRMSDTAERHSTASVDRQTDRGGSERDTERRTESEDRGRKNYSSEYDAANLWDSGAPPRRSGGGAGGPFYGNQNEPDWLEPGGRWPGGKDGAPQASGSGWSPQATQYIQEKKEDIEKVYKNDCETFVSVVKMLINKDPKLESTLQHSLRENLKEIGQHCILELREYIDRLREKEDGVNSGPMGVI